MIELNRDSVLQPERICTQEPDRRAGLFGSFSVSSFSVFHKSLGFERLPGESWS